MAHPLWSQVLLDKPDDAEARIAKDKCEYEILNKMLVTLRD